MLISREFLLCGRLEVRMGKPTRQESGQALEKAKNMREHGEDPDFLAKALLNCNYQTGYLLAVLHAAENYLRSGLSEREHAMLQMAIERARQVDDRSAHREPPSLGL